MFATNTQAYPYRFFDAFLQILGTASNIFSRALHVRLVAHIMRELQDLTSMLAMCTVVLSHIPIPLLRESFRLPCPSHFALHVPFALQPTWKDKKTA